MPVETKNTITIFGDFIVTKAFFSENIWKRNIYQN